MKETLERLEKFTSATPPGWRTEAEDYFFADHVFYHRILKCHVIVELKIDKFHHEYASRLNMYLNYFKAEVMQPDDNPPIGILLCTEKGDTLVKYATAGLDPNIFVQEGVHDRTSKRGRNKGVLCFLKLLTYHQK